MVRLDIPDGFVKLRMVDFASMPFGMRSSTCSDVSTVVARQLISMTRPM